MSKQLLEENTKTQTNKHYSPCYRHT